MTFVYFNDCEKMMSKHLQYSEGMINSQNLCFIQNILFLITGSDKYYMYNVTNMSSLFSI